MSGRAARSRRRSAAPEEEELDGTVEHESDAEQTQSNRRKKRRSVSEPRDAANGSTGAYQDASGAAAAAGAGPRQRLPRIPISQQDVAKMEELINKYKEEATAAREKAADLGVASTNVDQLVAKVVRMMLFKNYEKPGVPVKREELIKEIQKDQKGGRGAKQLPSLVLPIAAAKLASVFGLEMLELKRGAAPAAAGAAAGETASSTGGVQTFVLRSLLQPSLVERFVQDSADDPARGLMTVVAALLELAPGKQMDAEELSRHLVQLGVLEDPAEHESYEQMNVFGKDKAAGVLTHMANMRLIVKKQVMQQQVAGGGAATVYELAEAAYEPKFKAGIKALLDQWLGPAGSAAPATAAAEGTQVQ